jgi:glycosyltransferase involved in cell wall biosynthesis
MIKKIGILTLWEFPEGMAPTTRILAYSKGLVENGIVVDIFSFKRIFKDEIQNIKKSGDINGVNYTYLHFFSTIGKNVKLFRVIDELILRVKLFFKIWRSNRSNLFDCFFISFDDNHSFSAYLRLLKIMRIPLVLVADEFPIPIRDFMKDEVPDDMLVKYRYHHKSFSARILMSRTLREFYDKQIFPKPSFILNTIIDASRFNEQNHYVRSSKPYICYMGNMDLRKDNVQNIIEAFSLINSEFFELELHLYGVPDPKHLSYLIEKTKSLGITNNVLFKGRASYLEVPGILKNAKVLVNSQPITKRAQGGFPTKLGEYLLSSRPSVFTDSGDISFYIEHGKHAFIVEPENSIAYSKTLRYIIENYSEALIIAREGEKFVKENFDAKKQTKALLEFLEANLN